MKKDIFIDNNIAMNFANPSDAEYKKLLRWLYVYNHNPNKDAYLVVSIKLIEEYISTSGNCHASINICAIVAKLQAEGRLVIKSSKEIKLFRKTYYKKHIVKHLTCTKIDREYHIPTVLLSQRRYALSIDDAFVNDLLHFPHFAAVAAKRPESLNYA